jgi:hypothetical protein
MDTDASLRAATDKHGYLFIISVIPANAGIQAIAAGVDSRVRENNE